MQEDFVEAVYLSLCGELVESARINDVEDAFREGSLCCRWYALILGARNRLLERLGVFEDDDLELMLTYQMMIQEELCCKCFTMAPLFPCKTEPHNRKVVGFFILAG